MTIGDQGSHHIDHKIVYTSMTGVLNLRIVLQLIDHCLHQGTLSKQNLVDQVHQSVLLGGVPFWWILVSSPKSLPDCEPRPYP
jgi:hypothetical protein